MIDLPENIADAPENPVQSATKPPRKSPGRPFTKDNAKQMAISAAKAKAMRKEARNRMLATLTTELDLGEELVKAWKHCDDKQMALIEKALRIVGLHHDQSPDAQAQKISLDAKTDNKVYGNVNITVKGLDDV